MKWLNILVIAAGIWAYSRAFRNHTIYRYFWPSYAWKLFLGLALGYIYADFLGGGDTWAYRYDASLVAQWGWQHPWEYLRSLFSKSIDPELLAQLQAAGQPRALFMVKMLAPFSALCGNDYWLMSAYLSSLSFMGMWLVATRLAETYQAHRKAVVAAILFFPSVVFWSSGVSKEGLFMAGWGLIIAYSWPYFKHWRPPQLLRIALLLLVVYFMFRLKYYYVVVLVPLLLTTLILYRSKHTSWAYIWRWSLLLVVILLLGSFAHPNLQPWRILGVIKANALEIVQKSHPQALINYWEHADPLVWCLINLPKALWAGLIRPMVWDWSSSWWQNLVVVENLFLFLIAWGNLKEIGGLKLKPQIVLPVFVYILTLAALLALSTPNLGTLTRFKVAYLPLLIFILLAFNPWWSKIAHKLP